VSAAAALLVPSLDSCHTLDISRTKANPVTLAPCHTLRTGAKTVTNGSLRIVHFASSICTSMVVSSVTSHVVMFHHSLPSHLHRLEAKVEGSTCLSYVGPTVD
jgi:hypothetical protein